MPKGIPAAGKRKPGKNKQAISHLTQYGGANATKKQVEKTRQGRPSLYSPEIHIRIVQYIRAGNYPYVAAQACGICYRTFCNWMERGERVGTKEEEIGDSDYEIFFHDVKKAEAESEVAAAALVKGAAQQNWTAGMTWLERRFRSRWTRGEFVANPDGSPVQPASVKVEQNTGLTLKDLDVESLRLLSQLKKSLEKA